MEILKSVGINAQGTTLRVRAKRCPEMWRAWRTFRVGRQPVLQHHLGQQVPLKRPWGDESDRGAFAQQIGGSQESSSKETRLGPLTYIPICRVAAKSVMKADPARWGRELTTLPLRWWTFGRICSMPFHGGTPTGRPIVPPSPQRLRLYSSVDLSLFSLLTAVRPA